MSARLRLRRASLGLALALAVAALPEVGEAFRNVQVGEVVPNSTLPTLDGKELALLADDCRVNVFLFFRPDQEHSREVLAELAKCEKKLEGQGVRWVAVVSDRYPKEEVQAMLTEAGVAMPVLVDAGDALYGRLGVKLHPVVGIAGPEGKLLAYQPFTKVNYCVVVEARIRHALGEIDDAALAHALNPTRMHQGDDAAVAKRNVNFARLLLKRGKWASAAEKARHALELDPQNAEAHALLGAALAGDGKCGEAGPELAEALRLDAESGVAKEALARCPAE